MLVLSRFAGQEIIIAHPAGDVRVVVHSVRGQQVRLGVVAPKEVAVDRSEIHAAKLCNVARAELGGEG